jgi:hypothetical protein
MSGHTDGSRAFGRYRHIDDEIKKELVNYWIRNVITTIMDTTDKRYANFNAFKEDLLQWKNAHQDEYAQFARQMNDGDGFQFVRFFYAANQQLPAL